jgi:hypothetical protein
MQAGVAEHRERVQDQGTGPVGASAERRGIVVKHVGLSTKATTVTERPCQGRDGNVTDGGT